MLWGPPIVPDRHWSETTAVPGALRDGEGRTVSLHIDIAMRQASTAATISDLITGAMTRLRSRLSNDPAPWTPSLGVRCCSSRYSQPDANTRPGGGWIIQSVDGLVIDANSFHTEHVLRSSHGRADTAADARIQALALLLGTRFGRANSEVYRKRRSWGVPGVTSGSLWGSLRICQATN